jgi:t-SNARE complex subunit (syntaxin)
VQSSDIFYLARELPLLLIVVVVIVVIVVIVVGVTSSSFHDRIYV